MSIDGKTEIRELPTENRRSIYQVDPATLNGVAILSEVFHSLENGKTQSKDLCRVQLSCRAKITA